MKKTKILFLVSAIVLLAAQNAFADFTIQSGETFVLSASETFTVAGTLTIASSGILDASAGSTTVSLSDDWLNSGTFTAGDGNVVFTGSGASAVSGSNSFYNFTCVTANKQLTFDAGVTQIISNTLNLNGQASGTEILLRSSSVGTRWTFNVTGSAQSVNYVDVEDSNASTNNIVAVTSINSGNNDNAESPPHWVFGASSTITSPVASSTVGRQPTIMGTSGPSDVVEIYGLVSGVLTKVAETTADTSGNFWVMQSDFTAQLDTGVNSLTPRVSGINGASVSLTVSASPTSNQVPTIVSPVDGGFIMGNTPGITGQALAGQTITLTARDSNGNLLMSEVASSTVAGDGSYTISASDYTTPLPKGVVYLAVRVNGVNSLSIYVSLYDPFGIIFDSVTDDVIQGAVVTIYNSSGALCTPGVEIASTDTNPKTTGSDGSYGFIASDGDYYITVSASGYDYPSQETTFPSGRVIVTGSKGEVFSIAGSVVQIDHPMDPNATLLKIEKVANKKEISVGDIVTYTITIKNITGDDVPGVYLEDKIPAGFKYIDGKARLDDISIAPSGNRPIVFNIGTLTSGQTRTLRYQLVVGSGVGFGNYENRAYAKYSNGTIISNSAISTVKIVPDPLFDLSVVIGKVFWDVNMNGLQDAPVGGLIEKGVPGARIVMEDGTIVTTDSDGKFHFPSIAAGTHIFRLDKNSLPKGAVITTRREYTIVVSSGLLSKVNFGVAYKDEDRMKEEAAEASAPINIIKDPSGPKPRLNVSMFDETPVICNAKLKEPAEFRIFTNYSLFIDRWRLDIIDKAVNRLVERFQGNRGMLFEPIIWDGLDRRNKIIRPNRTYIYRLTVYGKGSSFDMTKDREFTASLEKEPQKYDILEDISEKSARIEKEKNKWVIAENKVNNLDVQNIVLDGGMVEVYGPNAAIKEITLKKNNAVFGRVPVLGESVSASDLLDNPRLMALGDAADAVDIIVPNGEYSILVNARDLSREGEGISGVAAGGYSGEIKYQPVNYESELSVGDSDFFLVGMGDLSFGENTLKGNIEPIQSSDDFKDGFWVDGKLAYFLKAKIKGKYLVTSSLDTTRQQKELFKTIDPDKYYPIYGDASQIDYAASDTQGPFYLLIQWDKSEIKWGNYETNFVDTELGKYKRTLYGGKVSYESLSGTQYGEPDTKVVIFGAQAKQMASHNEFVGTGGSLFYLKHQHIVEGSEGVEIQVRDKVNGLVLVNIEQIRGSDYEINYDEGRIIFWKPVSFISESSSVISSKTSEGNSVYVVVDYEYETKDKYDEATRGARVSQQIGDNVRVGGTYVKEEKDQQNFELTGYDATVRLGKNTKVDAEYATSASAQLNNYVSTNGGISFTRITGDDPYYGTAISVKGESAISDKAKVEAYYQKIGRGFSTAGTVSDQGTEKMGVRGTVQLTDKTEVVVSHDIQKLLEEGTQQSQVQIGAKETQTSMIQLVHSLRKADITAEYRRIRSRGRISGVESETNLDSDIIGARFDYYPFEKLDLSIAQQITLRGEDANKTTLGAIYRPTERLALKVQQSLGEDSRSYALGADYNVTDSVTVSGMRSIDGEDNISSLTGKVKVDKDTEAYATISQEDVIDSSKKDVVIFGTSRKLGDGYSAGTERSFARSDKETTVGTTYSLSREFKGRRIEGSLTNEESQLDSGVEHSNILGLSGELNDKFAFESSFEKGTIDNLDKTQTERYALALAASYVDKDKMKASLKLEGRYDEGEEDSQQILAYWSAEGRVARDWAIFNKAEISSSRNLATEETTGSYKEILIGFAYRPLYFDKLNLIGKYTYLEDSNPDSQEDYENILKSRSHVYGIEGIYDVDERNQMVGKFAFKQNEEQVLGFDDYTRTQTWLGILRYNRRFFKDYELGLEYRMLSQAEAQDYKQGALFEVSRYFGDWMKLGVGYNFTGFTDDLVHDNYSTYGWFVRATTSLGEAAYTLMRSKEQRKEDFMIESQRRLSEIMRAPKGKREVEEVEFYRDQAKYWMNMGEYQEAYNALRKGVERAGQIRNERLKSETMKLAHENKIKLEEMLNFDERINSIKENQLSQISLIQSREEQIYRTLQLFYETGKMYFKAEQYQKALNEWNLGLALLESFITLDEEYFN